MEDIEEEIINEEKYENKLEDIEEETINEIEEEEIVQNKCYNLEKCELCNEESILMNLCIKCNNNKGYYYLNESSLLTHQETNNYIECIKKNEKPSNFYFNQENKDFRLCYETCNTCEYGGDGNINNCTSCDINYFFKPDINNTTNCVIKCSFFYYYNKFGQYKCTSSFQCPKDYNLLVKAKKRCINNCEYDDTYKYQYNGECLIKCPNNTYHRDNEYICKDININKCLLSENSYYSLNENLTDNEIEIFSKNYAKEFKYTDNHVSIFKNNIYTITLYKNSECISDLSLEIPEIDFGECYTKVKKNYKIFDNLIIAIISKYFEGKNYQKMISFSMFEPINGTKLLFYEICKEDIIVIKENLIVKMDNSTDMKSLFYLADQDIDIFNLSSAFYTDICYHFNSPVEGKDIALKDRILLYFPNVTLCEEGCQIKGVNLTTFKAMCECLLDNFMGSNIFGNNILYQSSLGEIESLIKKTNIEVIKCYKDLLIWKYYISNTGGFIIIFLSLIQIILVIIYICNNKYSIRKYILKVTDRYLYYLSIPKNNNIMLSNFNNSLALQEQKLTKFNAPPKKNLENNQSDENKTKRNNKKTKTKSERNHRNKFKLHSIQPSNCQLNEIILETKYQNKVLNNTNTKNNNFLNISKTKENIKRNNKKRKSKKSCFTNRKTSINEILLNSNDCSYKNKLSTPSITAYTKNYIMINLNDRNDINIEEYLSTEPDDMDYYDVIKKDNRKFCQYFLDKLKVNHMIINTFFIKEPLRPRALKILLFIINIDLYLFINGLFLNEDYISQMFKVSDDEGIIPFIERFLDRFFYITLAGVIISYIIECFFVDEKKIKGILKREKDNTIILKYEITKAIKNIISRYNSFVILSFLISIFILYYVLCFNNIYPSMKGEWIKSTAIIIIAMQVLYVLQCLLETCIRFISFKCKSEKIYKISLLLS